MQVEIPHRLLTTRAPSDAPAPWARHATRWMVASTWVVIADGKRFEIPVGFVFDGSSVPRLLWWLWPPGYAPAWEAACFHDWCYAFGYRRVSKRFADDAFRSIMLRQGARPWIARIFHAAVSRFGRGGW
ncbi:Protein of unknown function [Halomonas shengliensis]|uniref:DUF1353 domain-containing protein n=1 Tax=Halomonas shengliensis TaxID=419597 RepID=A0A1H0LW22_9GAMM|nr:DUF1353 domain-containing protein [Halomonas shengliensis]SDO72251.1 Protein of unknown function [Halomonas shengliensis]